MEKANMSWLYGRIIWKKTKVEMIYINFNNDVLSN